MSDHALGRLEPVDLETVWDNEPAAFTPWLAEEENLRILGDTLGFDLELEALERTVGPFRADIACHDTCTGERVLIENQLGRTNHIHLGQTFIHAAGLDDDAVVWEERPRERDCHISRYLHGADPDDESDWPRQHAWIAQTVNEMHRVFSRRVGEL